QSTLTNTLSLHAALPISMGERPLRAVISAASPDAIAEVLRFAGEVQFVAPHELARGEGGHPDVIVVDEAAQLPVPLLQCLVRTRSEEHTSELQSRENLVC